MNNAGVVRDNILLRMKDDEWEDVSKSDLSSALLREAIRDMTRAKWGGLYVSLRRWSNWK